MRYKCSAPVLLLFLPLILCVRIPPNPCPDIFKYFKDPNGRIYGEAKVPYDKATRLDFSVNASFVGQYSKSNLKLQMVTTLSELNDFTPSVVYSIFFPTQDIIPKITEIRYNGRIYCSGPAEPVISGTSGIRNVWYMTSYKFSRRPIGTYIQDKRPDGSDTDLPVKNPGHPQVPHTPHITQQQPIPVYVSPTPQPPEQVYTPQQLPQLPPETPQLQPQVPQWQPHVQTPVTGGDRTGIPPNKPAEDPYLSDDFINSIFTQPGTPATPVENNGFKCGVNSEAPANGLVPLILNSQNTQKGEYPWLVAFFAKKEQSEGFEYRCSANLISEKHVITAGRCVQYYKTRIVEAQNIRLVMGTNNITNWDKSGAVIRSVSSFTVHPDFIAQPKSADADLAVLTMSQSVQFSKMLLPVCLWWGKTDLHPLINRMGSIAGYGQDEDAQERGLLHVMRAKRADMPIVSQEDCQTSPLGFQGLISERTFCTKSTETPTGPCIGDSGSGFFITEDGVSYLRGIASAISLNNDKCDLSTQYSVFCDVAKFLDWIRNAMK